MRHLIPIALMILSTYPKEHTLYGLALALVCFDDNVVPAFHDRLLEEGLIDDETPNR